MSAFGKLKLGVAAASVACLAAGSALAQQAAGQRNATQLRDEVPGRAATDQTDRTTQPQRQQIRSSTTQIEQRNLRSQTGGSNQEVEKFLAGCLLAKNKSEIEFAQLAQQQSQNPQVKEFAQMLEQDHQKVVQQLEPLAGGQAGQTSTRSESQFQSTSANGQNDAQRQPSDTTRLPGSPGATQTTRSQTQTEAYGSQEMSGPFAQLAQIEKQIGERQKQAMLDELQQKSGAEFDKCYVGAMVGSHIQSLAALEVISQQQQGKLAQVAQQAQPTVQQHLDHAKQLAKQLEGATQPGSQAERQRPRTQRQ
jgi:predicted outer membrane protein